MSASPPTRSDAPDSDTPRLGARFVLSFGFGFFGIWLGFLTPIMLMLQIRVTELAPDSRTGTLSLVLAVGAVFGLLANPIAGRLSDRCTSRLGMRRPILLAGAALAFAGLVAVAAAGNVWGLLAGWCLTQIGCNTVLAALMALMPDHVPPRSRGRISGLLGVAQALAATLGTTLGGALNSVSTTAAVLVPGAVMVVGVAVVCLTLEDRILPAAERAPLKLGELLRSFTFSPRQHPDFAWAWISRFALFLGIASVLNYQVFYLTAQLGLTEARATTIIPMGMLMQTSIVVVVSAVAGPLSDRIRRRKVFLIAAGVLAAAGLLVLALGTTLPAYFAGMVLLGLGQGAYFAIDLALITDVLPSKDRDAAKDLGIINIANLLPQSFAPALAPMFLSIGFASRSAEPGSNYLMLFTAGAVFAVISAVSIAAIRGAR